MTLTSGLKQQRTKSTISLDKMAKKVASVASVRTPKEFHLSGYNFGYLHKLTSQNHLTVGIKRKNLKLQLVLY